VNYMKSTGYMKKNEMANFWADLTKIAVCNEMLNVAGDRS